MSVAIILGWHYSVPLKLSDMLQEYPPDKSRWAAYLRGCLWDQEVEEHVGEGTREEEHAGKKQLSLCCHALPDGSDSLTHGSKSAM